LFIFVEGNDDLRFFEKVIKPEIKHKFLSIKIITYKNEKEEKIRNYLRSIKSMKAEYIFVVDINYTPCITRKKSIVMNKFKRILEEDKIIVVKREIESWYAAGITPSVAKKLKIKYSKIKNPEDVTKEKFLSIIPSKYKTKLEFQLEVLNNYSLRHAAKKSKTLSYLLKKIDC